MRSDVALPDQAYEWCELCEERLATAQSADGVWACHQCQEKALQIIAGPNRKQRRAGAKAARLRNDGRPKG